MLYENRKSATNQYFLWFYVEIVESCKYQCNGQYQSFAEQMIQIKSREKRGLFSALLIIIIVCDYTNSVQKSCGKWMFSTLTAPANSGAISAEVKPAMPQPILVTKKVISGCCLAKAMNSST